MNTDELKPCPFCGSRDIDDEPVLCMVYCTNCDAQINSTEVDWNTRPIEDALNARIAELEGESERFTAHDATERQDDKSPNDTQTQTIVYGKESE